MQRWRRHGPHADAHADPNAYSNPDAYSNPNANANANANAVAARAPDAKRRHHAGA